MKNVSSAWLFEWCTQKKLKPEYSFEAKGKYPKVRYICTLNVTGIDYKAQKEAKNKKEAQTQCAWDFCEKLVEFTHINASDLPKKPDPDAPTSATGTSGSVASTAANNGSSGRVSIVTSRFRGKSFFKIYFFLFSTLLQELVKWVWKKMAAGR